MEIRKDEKGHIGAIFGFNGKYICTCPICCGTYANMFCKEKFQEDGHDTKEKAIEEWNQFNRD